MAEWKIELDPSIVKPLADSIRQDTAINPDDPGGIRLLVEVSIARINGVKVEIFANEHPPPHFRVMYQGSTANFEIRDCALINGSREILRHQRKIRDWWKGHKQDLIDAWNNLRPSDCPVGKYRDS